MALSSKEIKALSPLEMISRTIRPLQYNHCGDWARENRFLDGQESIPGVFEIERTPYLIDIAKALEDHRFTIVAIMCGAQMSKTETCFNFICHRQDKRAQPAMFVFPTEQLARRTSTTRFSKVLKSTKKLKDKYVSGKKDNTLLKKIGETFLYFSYATSATQLCSYPIATGVIDEFDRTKNNIDGEGSCLDLLFSRMDTFPNKKLLVTSTPLLVQTSKIYKLWDEGTALRWYIKCPGCGEWVLMCFDFFRWDDEDPRKVKRAWLECNHCQFEIDDKYHVYKNQPGNGAYFREKDGKLYTLEDLLAEGLEFDTASFWPSGLASPWKTFLYCAKRWLKALSSRDEGRKQPAMNTVFGEPYHGSGEGVKYSAVKACCQEYQLGQLKKSCSDVLFMTVDVQGDRIYFVIRGWNTQGQSALVDKGCIYGNTSEHYIWARLYNLTLETWSDKYPINYVFIDANWRTATVYSFCKRFGSRFIPFLGRETGRVSSPVRSSPVEIKENGKVRRLGLKRFVFDEGFFKQKLYSCIKEKVNWFVPYDIDEDYCRQVTAESCYNDGINQKWVKNYRDNHYLDCEKMQLVAAFMFRIDLGKLRDDIFEEENNLKPISKEKYFNQADKMICSMEVREREVIEVIEKDSDKPKIRSKPAQNVVLEEGTNSQKKIKQKNKKNTENVLHLLNNSSNIGINIWG